MYWLNGGDAGKFVESVEDAYKKVSKAGPSPLNLVDDKSKVEAKQVITTPTE